MKDEDEFRLSSQNKSFIYCGVLFLLFAYAHAGRFSMLSGISYCVISLSVTWGALLLFDKFVVIDDALNDRINRALWAMLAAGLLIAAYHFATEAWHTECSQRVLSRDGSECVGDELPVRGGDSGTALMLLGLGIAAFWRSITSLDD